MPTTYTSSKQIADMLAKGTTSLNSEISARDDLVCDVFIAGSGPIGSTYARLLFEAGYNVVMCELGASDSFRELKTSPHGPVEAYIPGAHKKNEIEYQKDIDRFVHVIQGALSLVSVPVKELTADTIDPGAWGADLTKPPVSMGKNPNQTLDGNLSAQAVTRGVGGMATHWTCATPRFCRQIELPEIVEIINGNDDANFAEWERLYTVAEKLIGTTEEAFDRSIRHTLVLKTLQDKYEGRRFKPLPLACHRETRNPDYVNWHAADTILEPIITHPECRERFKLLSNSRVTRLALEPSKDENGEYKIGAAEVKDLLASADDETGDPCNFYVRAQVYIVAAGAVATPQILFNSGFHPPSNSHHKHWVPAVDLIPNLGKYITEQTLSFCQVILTKKLIESVPKNPYNLEWWAQKVRYQQEHHPEDPLQIPFRDAEPQVTTPFHVGQQWHTQIHRDAFSYGAVAATIDTRTIVDLRFFGYSKARPENKLTFETDYEDAYGMPQPTFDFHLCEEDQERAHDMMADMCEVAMKLGGFVPGSEPQFMAPGLALHLGGTTRAGLDRETHVADSYCRVYNFANMYVGGNGVIPTSFAANPTLTSIGYAVRASENIIERLGGPKKRT